jgi:hypothetical protein
MIGAALNAAECKVHCQEKKQNKKKRRRRI